MPDTNTAVNDAVSSASAKTKLNNAQSDEGKSPSEKELENRIRENLRGEYARKEQEQADKLAAYEDRIAELEEKDRLTAAEKEKLARLKDGRDDIEEELRILETDPKYRAYNEKIKRESKTSAEQSKAEAKHEMYVELMEDFIEDKADSEGLDSKELRKELNAILAGGKYADQNPLKRAKLAMKDRAKMKAFEKREAEIKAKEAELNGHLENGQTVAREVSLDDARKSGDTVARARALGL